MNQVGLVYEELEPYPSVIGVDIHKAKFHYIVNRGRIFDGMVFKIHDDSQYEEICRNAHREKIGDVFLRVIGQVRSQNILLTESFNQTLYGFIERQRDKLFDNFGVLEKEVLTIIKRVIKCFITLAEHGVYHGKIDATQIYLVNRKPRVLLVRSSTDHSDAAGHLKSMFRDLLSHVNHIYRVEHFLGIDHTEKKSLYHPLLLTHGQRIRLPIQIFNYLPKYYELKYAKNLYSEHNHPIKIWLYEQYKWLGLLKKEDTHKYCMAAFDKNKESYKDTRFDLLRFCRNYGSHINDGKNHYRYQVLLGDMNARELTLEEKNEILINLFKDKLLCDLFDAMDFSDLD